MENPMNTQGTDGDFVTGALPSLETLRIRVGRETRKGRLLSNLIEQRPWLNDTTGDRSWAKHPTQQMAWMMNVQVEALEARHDRS